MNRSDPTRLDPEIFETNLAALHQHQARTAEQLERCSLPQGVQAVAGRDGATTYLLPDSAGRCTWLGHSSMPSVSSAALLADFEPGMTNVLLPSLGHGYEARRLLTHLGAHQAVFAWDADPLIPALALRLRDFSDDISLGRLVLCVGPTPHDAVSGALQCWPTHLPPEKLLSVPFFSDTQIREVQRQVAAAAVKHQQQLTAALGGTQQEIHLQDHTACCASQRLAVLSMVPDVNIYEIAAGLAHAAEQQQRDCVVHLADRPERLHLLSFARLLARERFGEVILLDQVQREFGALLPDTVRCHSWYVSRRPPRMDLSTLVGSGEPLFAYGPEQAQHLRERLGAQADIKVTGPAADQHIFKPPQADQPQAVGCPEVAILLEAAPLTPEALGLKWDSHQALVTQAIQELRARPCRLSLPRADAWLDDLCARSGVRMEAAEIRQRLVQVISQQLAPTLTALGAVRGLLQAGVRVQVWGPGWERIPESAPWACSRWPDSAERNRIYNASAVVLHLMNDHRDEQFLVDSLAAEACVLRHEDSDAHAVGQRLLPELWHSVPSFRNINECVRRVQGWLGDAPRRRRDLSDAHQLARRAHLMQHRLQEVTRPQPPGMAAPAALIAAT